ncbi:hypothetical protein F4781DRAFT_238331 [Annulohypoxylon bovei var. microspora]|nr:hypothetical protein F4781DRAFT_238331 [Annulohypoxylon bovei var. microspora]
MKNVFAIVFLAVASSFVTGTPVFANERRALSASPFEIAARALELVPRTKMGSRASNETENIPRSVSVRASNSTSIGGGNEARSLEVPRALNSSDEKEVLSLFARALNSSEAETEKRAPQVKRVNFRARALNDTSA